MKKTIPLAYVTMLALLLAAALSVLVFSGPKSSELENRTLADPPTLTGESFSSGLFADQTEAFAEAHFPLRDQAVMLNATVNHLLGMTARQNVSLGPKGFFFDTSDGWSRRNVDLNLQAVQEIHEAAGIPTVVALVPSSGLILAGSLPEKPASGDRDELYAAEIPEGVLRVDLRETLGTAPDPEALYYRTDHHWTLDGAALGYRAVCGALGLDPEPVSVRASFPGFRGTLYARFPTLLAPEDTLSGVLLNVYGVGVLLMGESGMGKSETALELIDKGHVLISDDRVDVQHIHNSIIGHAPEMTRGFLEIRGIGIVPVEKIFGASALDDSAQVELVIKLVPFEGDAEYNRLGDESDRFTRILDVLIPTVILPVSAGRNVSVLVESAVSNFRLKQGGYSSSVDLRSRFRMLSGKE